MNKYVQIAGNIHLSYFVEAADILGINYEIVVPKMTARFETQGVHWFINNTVTPMTNAPSSRLSRAKNLCNIILDHAGLPVPKQIKVSEFKDLLDFFNQNKEIVVKPHQNLGGKGITILPDSIKELKRAYQFAAKNDKHKIVLAEKFIHGTNYRFLTIGDKVISVVRRLPARVTGDGKSTIKQLVDTENLQRKEKGLMAIPLDQECKEKLKDQKLKLNSIVEESKIVNLRANTNLTTGGTTEECSEIVHPHYIEIAVQALKAMDLQYGGIDLIAQDITQPGECAINEINYNPGLRLHYKVDKGVPIKVAVPIMEYIRDFYLKTKV